MRDLLASLRLTVLSIVVCCVLYTGVLWVFGQSVVPHRANGSLIEIDGRVVGSEQIAQGFTQPSYFWPRPSAVDYAADAAGGSNLSPFNPALRERATGIISALGVAGDATVPADLVAASGSGLDPHVTLGAALVQVPRVAAARGMNEQQVRQVVENAAETLPFGGERLVNVLKLNIALDATTDGRVARAE